VDKKKTIEDGWTEEVDTFLKTRKFFKDGQVIIQEDYHVREDPPRPFYPFSRLTLDMEEGVVIEEYFYEDQFSDCGDTTGVIETRERYHLIKDRLSKEDLDNSWYFMGGIVGLDESFHPNGQIKVIGEYNGWGKTGPWKYFDWDGNLIKTEEYGSYGTFRGVKTEKEKGEN